jgi:DNA-binding response OmpR family regulator
MSQLTYETALAVVYDPVAGNRAATRSALYSLGFRQIEIAPTLEALAEFVAVTPPDLVICEAQGFENELCAFIQHLRRDAAGYNPFLIIIVTAWKKSHTVARQIINSGADDLVLRPFSPALLEQRIRAQVDKRKGFVVTADYVGPDRSGDPRRASNVDLILPPNSLRMKAREGLTPEAVSSRLESELPAARQKLQIEKLRRDAFQLCVLWRLMHQHSRNTSRYEVDLQKMKSIAQGIRSRCGAGQFQDAVAPCDDVLAALQGLDLDLDRDTATRMLGEAALALQGALFPDKSQVERLTEIDTTVALIRARAEVSIAS